MVRPRLDRMLRVSTSAGRSVPRLRSIATVCSTDSGVRGSRLVEQRQQLAEEPQLASALSARRAGNGDLVAPDEDVAVQRLLDDVEDLVAAAQQGDHGLRGRYDDLADNAVGTGHGGGYAVRLLSARGLRGIDASRAARSSGRPPRTCQCRCSTVCPPSAPVLVTVRKPLAIPSCRATAAASPSTSPAGRGRRRPVRRVGCVLERDDEHVHRRLRVDVAEGERPRVRSGRSRRVRPRTAIRQNRQSVTACSLVSS